MRDYFRTGTTISNNLTVSQAFENAGARLSITRDDSKGIVPNSSLGKTSELAVGERDDQGEARRRRLAACTCRTAA